MCGIFALIGKMPHPATILDALATIRHRGQDGFGYWQCDKSSRPNGSPNVTHFRHAGKFNLAQLEAIFPDVLNVDQSCFIAHWRYATRGGGGVQESQPVLFDGGAGCLAHNGQFYFEENTHENRVSDTVRISRLLERHSPKISLIDRFASVLGNVAGAYAFVSAKDGYLLAGRDRFGIRPLFFGQYSGGFAVSSETTALTTLGCTEILEVPPGQVTQWSTSGQCGSVNLGEVTPALCAFEQIYFHAAEGKLGRGYVRAQRYKLGRQLAKEAAVENSLITSVPNSADAYAHGFADYSGLPFSPIVQLRPESTRTFIQNEKNRLDAVARKYKIRADLIRNRDVTIIDDSIVRGTTTKFLAQKLRLAGARKVHARIGSPPFRHSCYFGIDVPDPHQLSFHGRNQEQLMHELGLDSLEFLSINGMKKVLGDGLCTGCFTGIYPKGVFEPQRRDLNISAG